MEQILAFVLGVGAAAFVWAVVVAFKTTKKVETLQRDLESIVNMLDTVKRVRILTKTEEQYTNKLMDLIVELIKKLIE